MKFKKRDKRYNSYFDNYSDKVTGDFIGGLAWLALGAIGYGIYKLAVWFTT